MHREKASYKLFWILFFVYIINVLSKTAFAAVTVALVDEHILAKTQAGAVSGVFWITYAIGQLAGGFAANKVSPHKLVITSIIGSAVFNMMMPFGKSFGYMLIVWSLNGVVQFGMWPSILKLVSTEIIPEHRFKATGYLTYCYCIGMVLSYAITSYLLKFFTWDMLFTVCGVINAISLIPAVYAMKKLSPVLADEEKKAVGVKGQKGKLAPKIILESGIIFFCIVTVIKSIVEFGIKNWMPTILTETYGASPSYTSLLSVITMGLTIAGMAFCTFLYNKLRGDEPLSLCVMYLITLPAALLLIILDRLNIFAATAAMTVMGVICYGVAQTMLVKYPARFQSLGLVAVVGGIMNCFSAIGNFAASYGCGFVADNFGWDTMIILWCVLIITAIIMSALLIPSWKKFRKKYD